MLNSTVIQEYYFVFNWLRIMVKCCSVGTNDTLQNKKKENEHVIYIHIFFWFILVIQKTSLTSRDTCKECQTPSVTKIYSVGFNHETKNGIKGSSHSGVILCKRIKQSSILKRHIVKLIEITKSSCCFYGCLPICKNQHCSSI